MCCKTCGKYKCNYDCTFKSNDKISLYHIAGAEPKKMMMPFPCENCVQSARANDRKEEVKFHFALAGSVTTKNRREMRPGFFIAASIQIFLTGMAVNVSLDNDL